MLLPEERKTLAALILPSLGANPNTTVVAAFVGSDLALEMPAATVVLQIAEWIIDCALNQPAPDMLIRIINFVDDGTGRAGSLVDRANQLQVDASEWRAGGAGVIDWSLSGDPLEVHSGRPFVDRLQFRRLLPRRGNVDTPSCVLVSGGPGAGKTYLHDYCEQLKTYWRELRVGFTDLGPASEGPEWPAWELARGLGTDFGKKPRSHEDPHRYARNLAAWLTEFTPDYPLPALAIFDGFDDPGVPEPVHTLIEELVRSVQTDAQVRARLRVVLLGYDAGRLEKKEFEFTPYVLEFVEQEHIESWLRKRFPNQPGYRYTDAAELIQNQLPAGGPHRMRQLCTLMGFVEDEFRSV